MGAITRAFANNILTGGKLNADGLDLTDDYAFTGTVTGAGESNSPFVRTYGGTVTGNSNATWYKIEFPGTPTIDTTSDFDNVNDRYIPSKAGWYWCTVSSGQYTSPGAANQMQKNDVAIYKNGSQQQAITMEDRRDGSYPYSATHFIHLIVEMNGTTDYLEGWWRMSSTGEVNISGSQTMFQCYFLGTSS